jgi:hypothetical protein
MATTGKLTNFQVTQAQFWETPTGIILAQDTDADRVFKVSARSDFRAFDGDGPPGDFSISVPPIVLKPTQSPTTLTVEWFGCWTPNAAALAAGSFNPGLGIFTPGALMGQLDPGGSALILDSGDALVEGGDGNGGYAYAPGRLNDQPFYLLRSAWTLSGKDTAEALRAALAAGSTFYFDPNVGSAEYSGTTIAGGAGRIEVAGFTVRVDFEGAKGHGQVGALAAIAFMESEGYNAFGKAFPDYGKTIPVR